MRDTKREDILSIENNLSFHERIGVEEWSLRRDITRKIVTLFIGVNIIVVLIIILVYAVDSFFVYKGILNHGERIIDSKVIITVVGATTVQLGSIAFTLSRWLFGPRVIEKKAAQSP